MRRDFVLQFRVRAMRSGLRVIYGKVVSRLAMDFTLFFHNLFAQTQENFQQSHQKFKIISSNVFTKKLPVKPSISFGSFRFDHKKLFHFFDV
jgi:hypothetical protein